MEPRDCGATLHRTVALYNGAGQLTHEFSVHEPNEADEDKNWYLLERAALHSAINMLASSEDNHMLPLL